MTKQKPFIGAESIYATTLPALASDAPAEAAAAWLIAAAATTRNAFAAALARRAVLPKGGRRPLNRAAIFSRMDYLRNEGLASTIPQAARFVARENGGDTRLAATLAEAYRRARKKKTQPES